jgi:hypothetical protein
MNLHNEIMNIPTEVDFADWSDHDRQSYKRGHRDARHSAAELSFKAEARIEELEEVIKAFLDWTTNEHGTLSLLDDVALWKRAEEVLKK